MTAVVSSRVTSRPVSRAITVLFGARPPRQPRARGRRPSHPAGAVVGVADGDREGVGSVGAADCRGRKKTAHHHLHWVLLGATGTDHGHFHGLGAVFGDRDAGERRGKQRDGAGVAEFQGRGAVSIDVCFLDSRLVGAVGGDQLGQRVVEGAQVFGQAGGDIGGDDAVGNVAEVT